MTSLAVYIVSAVFVQVLLYYIIRLISLIYFIIVVMQHNFIAHYRQSLHNALATSTALA